MSSYFQNSLDMIICIFMSLSVRKAGRKLYLSYTRRNKLREAHLSKSTVLELSYISPLTCSSTDVKKQKSEHSTR